METLSFPGESAKCLLGFSYCVPFCSCRNVCGISLKVGMTSPSSALSQYEQGACHWFSRQGYSHLLGKERSGNVNLGFMRVDVGPASLSQGMQTLVFDLHPEFSARLYNRKNKPW